MFYSYVYYIIYFLQCSSYYSLLFNIDYFFFFQAEDGIRDIGVTGVQTCALPIYQREEEQNGDHHDAAADDVRLAPAVLRMPRLVAHRADDRLDQQAGDRAGDVEDRQVVRVRPQEQEDRVHRALGQPEAELHPEEPEIHPGDVPGGH